MSEVEDFTAEHADLRAELNVDYETWLVEDRLVSIKFIILVNMPDYAHPEVTVETFVYDLETVQPVFLEDILVEGSHPNWRSWPGMILPLTLIMLATLTLTCLLLVQSRYMTTTGVSC